MAEFGPIKDAPWWLWRLMAHKSRVVAGAVAALVFISGMAGPVLAIVVLTGLISLLSALTLFTGLFIFMWLITWLRLVVKGLTPDERGEEIVWYPSLSLPVFETARSRLGYSIVALLLAIASARQLYDVVANDAEWRFLPVAAISLVVILVGLRPIKSSEILTE